MKRRKRDTSNNKSARIEVRFVDSEKQMLLKRCKSAELTLSDYIRRAALDRKYVSKADLQTAFELRKIGVNLNQIAKYFNTLPADDDTRRVISSIEKYLATIDEMTNALLPK
ncbi:MobC family plasmid mobilization relaxosome protein [Parabacteroides sp. OttesenSCG-928-J18]|nr:MobC family plasmid mobilization relaxosome protein [Parabacteroides sp. OttesenSCG-928-O15]MDL2244458.1 MobC family plasmid mobilization relaxosome protein [Parabacteroides sp. OttesenSCG-928-J18]